MALESKGIDKTNSEGMDSEDEDYEEAGLLNAIEGKRPFPEKDSQTSSEESSSSVTESINYYAANQRQMIKVTSPSLKRVATAKPPPGKPSQKRKGESNISSDDDFGFQRVYNPGEYENLNVPPEIKELFQYISQYSPAPINAQAEIKLKPFIPEYYPSVGDIDAFIKVPHPWIENDGLGIKCLDEPSAFQSDPSVLDLRLRALAKKSSAKAVVVKKVENAAKNGKVIENWIKDISDLHQSKPSPSVHYTKPMPDVNQLLQEWPTDFEELLKRISLPRPDLECDLPTYVDIICNLLDIPVNRSRIQSLHLLATLYSAHKQFNQLRNDNEMPSALDDGVDRLELN